MRRETDPKPWYRARNIVLILALLFACLIGNEVRRALTARPGESVDYAQKLVDLAASVKPGADDDDNAWQLIQQVTARRRDVLYAMAAADPEFPPQGGIDFSLIYRTFDPADPAATGNAYGDQAEFDARRAQALAALEKYRQAGVFDSLAAATGKRVYVRPKPPEPLVELLIPELGIYRELAQANAARMRLTLAAQDQSEFVAAFEQSLALARLSTCDPIIIANLVGCAVANLSLDQVRQAILDGSLHPATLRALQAALDRQAALQPMALAIEGERISTLDIIQSTHTDDGNGDGRRIVSQWLKFKQDVGASSTQTRITALANLSAGLYPSKKQMTAKTNEYYDLVAATARVPWRERANLPSRPNPYTFIDELPWNYDVLKILAPAMSHAITRGDEMQADLAGMRILLALELYRAEHAKPPGSLDELVPSFLPALPPDPFAKDARFRYRILATPDADGRTYLLYSVGLDGTDDDGNEIPAGMKARPAQSSSLLRYDLLINRRPGRQ